MAASQTIRTLKLSLLADTSGFGKNLSSAKSDFDKFQQGISKAAVPAVAALAGIGTAAFSAIQSAADLSQTFGVLGRSAGLEGEALADFAVTLTTLASDLAAFGNTTPQEAIDALGSALRGEFNPIERFGVVLNAAAVQSIALREGLAETAAELTIQDTVYARFLGLMEQTAIQQGQAARESESLASQTNQAKANIENFRVEVGEQLLPVMEEFIPYLRDMVDGFTNTDPEKIITIAEAIAVLAGVIVTLNTALKVFSTLKATAAVLGFAGGGVVAGAAAAAALGYGVGTIVEDSGIDERLPEDAILRRGQGSAFAPAVSNRITPFRPRGGSSVITVNVSGFVGNERELARAIQRAQEQARRSGSVRAPGSFG